MGLVKAALGAASGVMGDQWKEYFTAVLSRRRCWRSRDRRSFRALFQPPRHREHHHRRLHRGGGRGPVRLIVEQGKVVDLCAEAGEYTYNTGTQPLC